jgi:DNA-binding CsgD family transcriptional regulator
MGRSDRRNRLGRVKVRNPVDRDRDLARGREACANREYAAAFDALSAADRAEPLAGGDLDHLAMAAGMLGRDEEFLRALERAHHAHLEAGAAAAAARAAFWIGFRLMSFGEKARAAGWLSRAQRMLDAQGADCVERGYLLLPAVRQHLAARDWDAAIGAASEAERIGERFGDADLVALARFVQGQALLRGERIAEGLALLDETMVGVAAGELSPLTTGVVYCGVIQCCQNVYALGRAREWTEALKAWCDAQPGSINFTGHCRVYRSEILQWNGDWRAATEEARLASERLAGSPEPGAAAPAFYQQGELHRLKGEFAEAEEAYASASRFGAEPQPGLALLRAAQGRVDAAASAMRRVLGALSDRLKRAPLLPAHVEIMLAAGDLEEARRASAELAELSGIFESEVVTAMSAHAAGAVALAEGDARAALPPLRRSFEIWRQLGAPYLAARARVLVGQACRAMGDEDGFRLETDGARAVFEELGAMPDLARLDAAEGRGPADRPHGLTPRELQVLRLVAGGKSNKAIAADLFLSEKTVDRHLSNIFGKLDVSSRAAATAFAYEHRLV